MTETSEDNASLIRTLGIEILSATPDEVVAEMEVRPRHLRGAHQGFGVVHGGVYCVLIETATSIGAHAVAKARGQGAPFGVEHNASFIRATTGGRVRVTATPVTRGRTTQVWEATVRDEKGQILATGRVRLLHVEDAKPAESYDNLLP